MSEIMKSTERLLLRPRGHRSWWRAGSVLAVSALVSAVLAGSAQVVAAGTVLPHPLTVDAAIGAAATASSAPDGSPAANAVDGTASTAWCATQWTGSVIVDLGSRHVLTGLGVTLGSTASASTVSIDLADNQDDWHPVTTARNVAMNGNTPGYIAVPAGQTARYARLTVTTGDGSPACVGEFRLFTDINRPDMMLGADLSAIRSSSRV